VPDVQKITDLPQGRRYGAARRRIAGHEVPDDQDALRQAGLQRLGSQQHETPLSSENLQT